MTPSTRRPPVDARPAIQIEIDHAGASVVDLARSTAFYGAAFGFAVEESFSIPGTGIDGVVLRHPSGARVELFRHPGSAAAPDGDPVESTLQRGWFQLPFRVADVSATYRHALGAGARGVREPFLAPDGRSQVAFVSDPDGHLVELIQRSAAR